MSDILRALIHKATPAAALLALTAVLTGCGAGSGEHILPYTHNASPGGGNQLVSLPLTELRHHQHVQHVVHIRRHPQHF